MRTYEYIEEATAYIADPERALAVRRELKAHLEDAAAELAAEGLDAEKAELVATGRMGSPKAVAMDLAATHHQHLPWRLYLAPLPILGLLLIAGAESNHMYHVDSSLRVITWLVLLFCLTPRWSTLASWGRTLYIDTLAKRHWLSRQNWRPAAVAGGAAGVACALTLTAALWMWQRLDGAAMVVSLLLAVGTGSGALYTARRFYGKGDPMLTAACTALGFPVGFLPALLGLVHSGNGLLSWFYLACAAGFLFLAIGSIAQRLEREAARARIITQAPNPPAE